MFFFLIHLVELALSYLHDKFEAAEVASLDSGMQCQPAGLVEHQTVGVMLINKQPYYLQVALVAGVMQWCLCLLIAGVDVIELLRLEQKLKQFKLAFHTGYVQSVRFF